MCYEMLHSFQNNLQFGVLSDLMTLGFWGLQQNPAQD